MSMNWPLDVEPAPKILVLPPDAADLGEAEAAIELWEHYSRKTLDPAQRLAVFVMMAQAADGKWAASTTGREMPRQNGKGDELEVVELWGLVQRSEAIVHTVHDAVLLASQTQQRMLGVLEGHADLRRLVKRKWQGTGQQMIEMTNGGVIWYRTRTGGGGRGVDDIDRLVVDEAQHATEEQLRAVSPTLLANDNPQLNAAGTAGLPNGSRWWWRLRKRALSEDPGRFGYVGHTAENVRLEGDGRVVQEPVPIEDREMWRAANPAVAAGRGGGLRFLEEQFRRMSGESFAGEHLGVWAPPTGEDDNRWRLFDRGHWEDGRVPATPDWLQGPFTYSVEVTENRDRFAIVAAGLSGTAVGVECGQFAAYDEDKAVSALVALHRKGWKACVIDKRSPAATLIRPLKQFHDIDIVEVGTEEYTAASQTMVDAHRNDLVHSDQDPYLDAAAAAAAPKKYSWGYLLDRGIDAAVPMSAAALARWGHLELEEPPPRSVYEDREPLTL